MSSRRRWWPWFALVATLTSLAALAGCPDRSREHRLAADLVSDLAIAEKRWEGMLLEFGSPSVRPFLGEGWSYGETAADGNGFRWALGERASFQFDSGKAGQQVGWVECEPYRYAGAPTQVLQFRLNGQSLAPLHLREGRGRYPLELSLKEGRNSLEIRFAYSRSPTEGSERSGDRRRLAVAFYRFDIPPAGHPPLAGKPGPFSLVKPKGGAAGVYLPGGGTLTYFLELPEDARLVVQGGARHPELLAPEGAALGVRLLREQGGEISETRKATAPRGEILNLALPLERLAGERVALSIRAESKSLFVVPSLYGLPGRQRRSDPNRNESISAGRRRRAVDHLNLLLLVLDGASASRLSAYGYRKPTTPAIDRLARESVVFENAVSQAVYTIASVGSILTGQYPERHQSVSFSDRLPSSAVTLPGLLTLGGFATAGFAGNKVVSSTFGLDRGYQEFHEVWNKPDYTGHGDSVTREVLAWLEKRRGKRFLAYVHFREPHFPYNPPRPFATRFGSGLLFPEGIRDWEEVEGLNRSAAQGKGVPGEVIERIRSLYEGNLAYADSQVGEILRKLDALGLSDRTAIFLTADHGEALFEHGFIGHNTQLYEESVRVPLLVKVPGFAPGKVSEVVELVDLAPTLLELAGLGASPAVGKMQGRSLIPLLQGETLPPRIAFSRTLWDKPRYAARDGRFKFIWDSRSGSSELYHLPSDPGERLDLDAARPLVAGFFRQQIFGWLREQERLRAGAPAPDRATVTEDLGRYLGGVGYFEYLRRPKR